jgi:hypothetical protein
MAQGLDRERGEIIAARGLTESAVRSLLRERSAMANALIVHKNRLPQSQKMHRAAQYVRMSTDYQRYSIENQAAVIAAYAELHKLFDCPHLSRRRRERPND